MDALLYTILSSMTNNQDKATQSPSANGVYSPTATSPSTVLPVGQTLTSGQQSKNNFLGWLPGGLGDTWGQTIGGMATALPPNLFKGIFSK